ncbi:glycosyltransferase family 4 protein [Orenia marismortui]|uniref:Glycosyltransferase involved in cell wall biosynthesis n=1 Tax=Orenia marismortui TaxID=46469 RepID=A0A4R8HQI7_9FIRM|nr:glycosyltransferase family 1 protein [Orenia marismortui]TDX59261.1 glycosyltransferase involved in cell wall biosynthesis [Orenia marismortui]
MNKILINALLVSEKSSGIGNYGYNLINSLDRLDLKYDISSLVQKKIESNNIDIQIKQCSNRYHRILYEQIPLRRNYKNYDLIHFIDYSSPIIAINTPFIVTIHDLSFYKYPETFNYGSRRIKQILAPISIKRSNKVIADSKNTKKEILSRFNINESKVKVIYPGSPSYNKIEDIRKLEAVKRKYGINQDYILYVGTIEPRKNLLRLLEAYHNLLKQGIKEKLVIVGKKGWLYEDIFKKVEELGLDKQVLFLGYLPEKEKVALYSGAKVFVYPSLYEGFGLPPLEAMSCGTPVVVSNSSSLPEVVGDSGIYVDPKRADSIAQGIYDLLDQKKLREKLSLLGVKRSKKFTWEKSIKNILEVYDKIL